ncbi:hypothetical protein [Vibrio xiamenensis]|nr:hypothetical protein [Vibrio xiamenensis]
MMIATDSENRVTLRQWDDHDFNDWLIEKPQELEDKKPVADTNHLYRLLN